MEYLETTTKTIILPKNKLADSSHRLVGEFG